MINLELFGYEKGAFIGVISECKGYFEMYDGGMIFLDEIGEMFMDMQFFLLCVLEIGEFIWVGVFKVYKIDVCIIVVINVFLLEVVKKGKFWEDFYYCLNIVFISVLFLWE